MNNINLEKGISIVIPVHDGRWYLERLIKNLNDLEVVESRFEVIFVFNGKLNEAYDYLVNDAKLSFDYLVLISDEKGASVARNLGKRFVKYSHTTFVDVDDLLSRNYIEESFQLLHKDKILVSQIYDVNEHGEINPYNNVNKPLLQTIEDGYRLNKIHAILGITTCKFIPSNLIEEIEFNPTLQSGEDTVFYAQLYAAFNPEFEIIDPQKEVIYYRYLSENSISRGKFSYDFNVAQRLDILDILDELLDKKILPRSRRFIEIKYRAQNGFITKYFNAYPDERAQFIEFLSLKKYRHINPYFINHGRANTFVISYYFPPFSDKLGIVMANRIAERAQFVDVFSKNMSTTKEVQALKTIGKKYIDTHMTFKEKNTSENHNEHADFIDETFLFYLKNSEKYDYVYTQAMFSIVDFGAVWIKLHNEAIKWCVEFVLENPAIHREIDEIHQYESLIQSITNNPKFEMFLPYLNDRLSNVLALTHFAFADELIFTSVHQLERMIEKFSMDIQEMIRRKSKISQLPIPNAALYSKNMSSKVLNKNDFNVGYFEEFHSENDVEVFINTVDEVIKMSDYNIKFHLQINVNHLSESAILRLQNHTYIHLNEQIPYLEFLNVLTKVDAILIFDTKANSLTSDSSHLPLNLGEYIGVHKPMIAIVKKDSPLNEYVEENIQILNNDSLDVKELSHVLNEEIKKIDRVIFKQESHDVFSTEYHGLQIEYTKNIECISEENKMIFKPNLPIIEKHLLSICILNELDVEMTVNLTSTYKDPMKVITIKSNEETFNNESIGQFFNGKTLTLGRKERITLELQYNKDYDKASFRNAGTIIMEKLETKNDKEGIIIVK